ncbi:hypothetical protein DYB32_002131 [Aphanomyces invadans]|nr:hypothetical protein DYB32_002131 [Aphanomyces invadans]
MLSSAVSSVAAPTLSSTLPMRRRLPLPFAGHALQPRRLASEDRSRPASPLSPAHHNKVIVVGLRKSLDDAGLRNMFSQYGTVIDAKVAVDDKKGVSSGYGFVTFTDAAAKYEAIKCMHQSSVNGVVLTVRDVSSKKHRLLDAGVNNPSKANGKKLKVEGGSTAHRRRYDNQDTESDEGDPIKSENCSANTHVGKSEDDGDDNRNHRCRSNRDNTGAKGFTLEDDERATRLKKDRMRKTKYRKQKLAQVDSLKNEAHFLELQLEQLKANMTDLHKSQHAHIAHGHGAVWQNICTAEAAKKRASLEEQECLYQSLVEHLHIAVSLKRRMMGNGPRHDVPLCFDPRGQPADPYCAKHTLSKHPVMRIQTVRAMLDDQLHQLADTFIAKLPTADHDGPFGLVLQHDDISFVEINKFGVVYGGVVDVGDVLWRVQLSSHGASTKVDLLDDHTCFLQTFKNDGLTMDGPTPHHYIAKRFIERGRQVLLLRSVLHDELSPHQNPAKDHVVSWVVVEDISHPHDNYPTTCIRGYTQMCLRTVEPTGASVQEYSVYMNDATKCNDLLNHELHRHFRCLILN